MSEETLFELLRNTPASERDAVLDRECGSDPALRTRVESLLHADANPDFTYDLPPDRTESHHETLGTVDTVIAGKYRLLECIGEGGMGSVWLAQQSEPVKRRVAVKLIKAGMDSKQVLARFDAERQALAVMDHPNIAKVLDGGLHEQRPYFVMELVKGVPITDYCDAKKLTPRERLELFVPVCQAIQHAHQKGIIHRDIKPSNVLIALYDDKPVPKVIDFGLAKATGGTLTDQSVMTAFGGVVGTPQYMSPEQASLNNLDIDTRSDVYSLGVLLYELLTGSPPFAKGELEKQGLLEMLRVVREDEPPKPSTKLSTADALPSLSANRGTEPKKLTALLRSELDWIVMKALEKDRSRRYETANGFAADVNRYLAGEAVQAHPPSRGYRLKKFVRKNRIALATTAAVMLLAVLGATVSAWQAHRALRAEQAAHDDRNRAWEAERLMAMKAVEAETARKAESEQRQIAETRRKAVEAVNRFLTTDMITSADPERAQGRELTVREVLDNAAAHVGEVFLGQPEIEVLIRMAIGKTYLNLSKYPAAETQLTRAATLGERTWGPTHIDALEINALLAATYQKAGKLDMAEKLYRKNFQQWIDHSEKDHSGTIKAKNDLALLLHFRGKRNEAETLLRQAAEQVRSSQRFEDTSTLSTLQNLALVLLENGKLAEAEPQAREALQHMHAKFGDHHPDTLSAMNTLGLILQALNQTDEAIGLGRTVIERRKLVQGDDHSDTLVAMNNLARLLHARGKMDEAEPLYLKSLAGFRKLYGEENTNTALLINNVATFYYAQRKLELAEPLFRRAYASALKLHGPENANSLQFATNLATVLTAMGQLTEAESLFRDTLAIQQRVSNPKHPSTAQTLHNLADCLRQQGRYEAAVPLFREALAICRETFPAHHPSTFGALAALGWTLSDMGRSSDAEPVLREAFDSIQRALPQGHPNIAHVQSLLGACLMGQSRWSDAEPLLLEAYGTMEKQAAMISAMNQPRIAGAVDRLIQLYSAKKQPAEAEKWRTERKKYSRETAPQPRPVK